MPYAHHGALRCPLDGLPLAQVADGVSCEQGHAFDIARQGYINLLGANDKRSADPGDSKAMVQARREFLEGDYYRPLLTEVYASIKAALQPGDTVLDAGCGEGYYLAGLDRLLRAEGGVNLQFVGLDVSKWAVRAAARRIAATWMVASNRRIPIAQDSVDVVLDLFGFPHFGEFVRVLKPGGLLLRATAGQNHLRELRHVIYADVPLTEAPAIRETTAADEPPQLIRVGHTQVYSTLGSLPQPALGQLFQMTPHYFRASRAARERVSSLSELDLSVHVNIDVYQRIPAANASS